MGRGVSDRALAVFVFCAGYALATLVGYVLPIVIRTTVEAVSTAFVLGIAAAFAGSVLVDRLRK